MDEQDKDACWSVSRMEERTRSPPVKTCRLLRGAYFINPRSAVVGGEAKRGANRTTGGPRNTCSSITSSSAKSVLMCMKR